MREIEFRAKTMPKLLGVIDSTPQYTNSEWVYGYYAPTYLFEKDGKIKNNYQIISDKFIGKQEMIGCGVNSGLPMCYNIMQETLGQYTGLKDKNGKKIFEGDIISADYYPFIDDNKQNYVGVIEYIPELASFQYILNCVNTDKNGISNGINEELEGNENLILEEFEVIGNIYDNTELLGEEV